MSGGHFDYNQHRIEAIADEVESIIQNSENGDDAVLDEWGHSYVSKYAPEVIEEFRRGLAVLRAAAVYAQRIDWLVSGDDGEAAFLRRLHSDLEAVTEAYGSVTVDMVDTREV